MHFSQGYWQFAEHVHYFSQSIDSLLNMHFSQGYLQFAEHVFQPQNTGILLISAKNIASLLNIFIIRGY
jgi:hypothetical protein